MKRSSLTNSPSKMNNPSEFIPSETELMKTTRNSFHNGNQYNISSPYKPVKQDNFDLNLI